MTSVSATRLLLSAAALAMAAYALYALTKLVVPETNRDALMVALGVILGLSKDVFSFFFGSSKGSEDKTALLNAGEDKVP